MRKTISVIFLSLWALTAGAIDFDSSTGRVKPVNGVGQPPILGWCNMSMFHYLTEAGIPYSRLHDVHFPFGGNIYVDIPNLFKDFDADETLAQSYDFAFTDSLMCSLQRAGVEPFFRLGVTIENARDVKAYRIYPPKDFAKWARICEHVILHYTEGWADGFHMKIDYWEIWNEPENLPDPMQNQMWRGTFDQYMDMYGVAATYLKGKFPHLKIGGYASCGFYKVTVEKLGPVNRFYDECFHKFLKAVKENGWPLDFFSCHSYDSPANALKQFEYARKTLDDYGFKGLELIVNEWLPQPSIAKLGTAQQAAEIAAELIAFQNGPVDQAEIYDAKATGGTYGPLFAPEVNTPRKAYYAFMMFNELRKLGNAVQAPEVPDGIWAAGATDLGGKAVLMISNISGSSWRCKLDFGRYKVVGAKITDDKHMYDDFRFRGIVKPDSVVLLFLEARN